MDPTPSNDRERFGVTHQDSISTSKFFKQGTHHYRTRVVCQVSENVPFVFTMVKTWPLKTVVGDLQLENEHLSSFLRLFKVFQGVFFTFYHSKSLWNHHLGNIYIYIYAVLLFFPTTLSKSKFFFYLTAHWGVNAQLLYRRLVCLGAHGNSGCICCKPKFCPGEKRKDIFNPQK